MLHSFTIQNLHWKFGDFPSLEVILSIDGIPILFKVVSGADIAMVEATYTVDIACIIYNSKIVIHTYYSLFNI